MAQTEKNWPKENTAFLVIHGVGSHRPFEVLDAFARNFLDVLKVDKKVKVKCTHKVQRHNDWIESYISSSIDGMEGTPALDFYEYYWDCYMTREITVKELIEWIDMASAGAKYFYKNEMPELAKKYEKEGVDLFKDGEFRGYDVLINRFGLIQWLIRRIASSRFRFLIERLSQWTSVKDLVIYTTSDVRSQHYEIRRKILDGAVEELRLLLDSNHYDQIVVVGHSLGSAIAYDALDRIAHDMNVPGGISQDSARKLKGLITLGSPLDKIAFCFAKRTPEKNLIQRAILAHFHNFKRRELTMDRHARDIKDPFQKKLNVRWVNFYHLKDRISGHLDAYYVADEDNVPCKETIPGIGSHSCYWQLRTEFHDKIIQSFF